MKNLKQYFLSKGFELSENQEKQFQIYFTQLVETNKVLNLTAITEEQDVLTKHFLDSVLPINEFSKNCSMIDVGTGAGFPGLPIKILRPDVDLCLLDSLNKRVSFLNDVIEKLGLKNVTAVHSRAEDFARKNRETFDFAVARAVAPLNTLVEYLLPFVKVGGKAVIYKSTKLEEELENALKAIEILGAKIEKVEKFKIDGEIERNILILKKINSTPNKFPRDKNKPKINPIV